MLGACEHLAQVYHEFRRRYGARAVRRFVRRALVEYIYWEPSREDAAPAEAEEAAPADEVMQEENEVEVYASADWTP